MQPTPCIVKVRGIICLVWCLVGFTQLYQHTLAWVGEVFRIGQHGPGHMYSTLRPPFQVPFKFFWRAQFKGW